MKQEGLAQLVSSAQRKSATWFLIDPTKSVFLPRWDCIGGIVLIYTAIVTPYEVAFLQPSKTALSGRFILNRVIDTFFTMDLILQFFIM